MFDRSKKLIKIFNNQNINKHIKYKAVMVAFVQKLGYNQNVTGRCISVRSRGKISSIVIRNKQYGIYIRFILNNPKLVIIYL